MQEVNICPRCKEYEVMDGFGGLCINCFGGYTGNVVQLGRQQPAQPRNAVVPRPGPTVSLADLLAKVEKLLNRYVALPSTHEVVVVTLWVLHTWFFEAAETTPYLNISSATPQSGKTRLFEVLELLVRKPFKVVNFTEAVLFRYIDAETPTALLDEIDQVFGKERTAISGILAVLNSGYRTGGWVPRNVGAGVGMQVVKFNTFCPKAFAGLGRLPDTVADRSIPIRLKRRRRTEAVSRFRQATAREEAQPVADACESWAESATEQLLGLTPDIPEILSDRMADCWEPLLAIAELAGGEWPQRARAAAVALSGTNADEETLGILLLRHIGETFNDQRNPDYLHSDDLLRQLATREDGPWAERWGRDLDAGRRAGPGASLARLLRAFDIAPRDIRGNGRVRKGYRRADFEDVWVRYLPENRDTATTQVNEGEVGQPDVP
jgi:hypothetical protein